MSSTPQTFDAPLAFKKKWKSVEKMAKISKNAMFWQKLGRIVYKTPQNSPFAFHISRGTSFEKHWDRTTSDFFEKVPKNALKCPILAKS